MLEMQTSMKLSQRKVNLDEPVSENARNIFIHIFNKLVDLGVSPAKVGGKSKTHLLNTAETGDKHRLHGPLSL